MATNHALNYVELPAADLQAAKDFYGSVFGWRFTDYGDAYVGFASGAAGDDEDGGFDPTGTPGPAGPLVLLYADDLDAAVAAVRASAGTVRREPYSFPGGRRFHFTDPAGNELGVWSRT